MFKNLPRTKDITGKEHGHLVAIKPLRRNKHGCAVWLWQCDCGGTKESTFNAMRHHKAPHCGCRTADNKRAAIQKAIDATRKHGFSTHPLFFVFSSMKQRCYNPRCSDYRWYGEKGVRIWDGWCYETFVQWALNNGWEPGLTIDRIDSDGDYHPDNCRFIPLKENVKRVHADKENNLRPNPE